MKITKLLLHIKLSLVLCAIAFDCCLAIGPLTLTQWGCAFEGSKKISCSGLMAIYQHLICMFTTQQARRQLSYKQTLNLSDTTSAINDVAVYTIKMIVIYILPSQQKTTYKFSFGTALSSINSGESYYHGNS